MYAVDPTNPSNSAPHARTNAANSGHKQNQIKPYRLLFVVVVCIVNEDGSKLLRVDS